MEDFPAVVVGLGGAGEWVFDADEVCGVRHLLAFVFLLGVAGCQQPNATQSEFAVSAASGDVPSFLIEKRTGCIWAIVIDGSAITRDPSEKGPSPWSVGDEMGLAKTLGYYRLVNVKSPKRDFCQKTFGFGDPEHEGKVK
jgi:hypothetical protein